MFERRSEDEHSIAAVVKFLVETWPESFADADRFEIATLSFEIATLTLGLFSWYRIHRRN